MKIRLALPALILGVLGVMPVVHAPPAQAAVNNDTIVQSWYRNFLGRTSENAAADSGRFYWVDQLNRGVPRENVLGGILRNYEYANLEVSSYYTDLLGRAPDPGASYWINNTAYNNMAWEWVKQNILASNEYRYRYQYLDDSYYIDRLYSEILGRYSPSAGEVSYWTSRLNRVGALAVVREIWYSDEAIRYRVNENYENLLFRGVDLNGLNYWYPIERQSDITVQVALASTNEYVSQRVY